MPGVNSIVSETLDALHRFVEEAYRGEPQTPVVGGLRLYQWLAVILVVAVDFPGSDRKYARLAS